MLEGLVNVGTVDCSVEQELCELLDASSGASYYPAKKVQKGYEQVFFADCSKFVEVCRNMLDMDKLPQFVTFKTTGGYEIDYGRLLLSIP
ncbi:unnamed protein product [Strongylus vulgaris]|uniref:Uncharacterized protein n=1 Tax=Strongylus vulgaris TaxID=40348 RepID=A0A3P7IUZ9_STRVU|nr:unnamed protein product [Strongylus vulgaris]